MEDVRVPLMVATEHEDMKDGSNTNVSSRITISHVPAYHKSSSLKEYILTRIRLLLCPIKVVHRRVATNKEDVETVVLLRPEAFRMLFYILFILLILLGILVSTQFSDTFSEDENPVVLLFGNNNLCIYFDFPPFTYFSAFLYVCIVNFPLAFEILDWIRVYDCYCDRDLIGKKFFRLYTCSTIYESLSFLYFVQIFATQPTQPKPAIYVHVIPFINLIMALWLLAFKRTVYNIRVRDVNHTLAENRYCAIGGILYVVSLGIIVLIKVPFMWINLFGAYLWKKDGWEWTSTLTGTIDQLFTIFVVILPLIINFFGATTVESLICTIKRQRHDIL